MKLLIFSVYDKAVKAYLHPFYARTKGEAIRSFMEAVSDAKSSFAKHAEDYVMMYLGEFDDGTGIFACREPERVIGALECMPDNVASFTSGAAN